MRTISTFVLVSMLFAGINKAALAETQLTFGVVPQQSASRLARVWLPVTSHLSEKTGILIRFATAKDIPTFEACLAKKAYDIAYMNPYHYVVFHDMSGYQAIAHQKDKQLTGILVAHKDSSIETLTDLSGKSIAFPSPAAFGASVLPRAEMQRNGIKFAPKYVESHDSVYRAVAAGHFIAGGGVKRTWRTVSEDVRKNLKIVYETDAYTPHAFAVLETLPIEDIKLLKEALTSISFEAPELLKPIGMPGIEMATDAEWDDVRALSLSKDATQVNDEANSTCPSN